MIEEYEKSVEEYQMKNGKAEIKENYKKEQV